MEYNPKQSDRDVSADAPKSSRECAARLMAQSGLAELFDDLARQRFGKWISAARLRPEKRKRQSQP